MVLSVHYILPYMPGHHTISNQLGSEVCRLPVMPGMVLLSDECVACQGYK